MVKKTLYILVAIVSMALVSCKGSKNAIEGDTISNMPLSKVITYHENAFPNFQTLASRVQVVYDDGHKEQSITVSLRMEKDKAIWIKASILGITLAKAMITPEKVQYYETVSNTYFDGDFSILAEWLGTDLDFQKTQAMLLGQSIFAINDSNYKVSPAQKRYKIQPKRQPQNFIHSLFLNSQNFKVASGSLSQPNEDRMFSVRYGDYQLLDGGYYPSDITIDATDRNEKTKISVIYKKIDVNAPISFPFEIPEGFELIQLTK